MIARWFAVVALLLLPTAALAHLLPKQNATMHIAGNAAFFVVAVPVSAFTGVDDDANGLLSGAEIARHQRQIQRQFEDGFDVRDGRNAGTGALTWVTSPLTDGESHDTDYVIILKRVDFAAQPQHPTIAIKLFGTGTGEREWSFKASRGDTVEMAVLDKAAPIHSFFRGQAAIFGDFVALGFEHIWTGYDHLLFLLTIVMAGAGLRYWPVVVTSFTIAHSITLALAAFDVLRLDSAIVEPGIALSIVLVALINLSGFARGVQAPGWARIGVVFACGLLHGFGFASAISSFGIGAGNRLATLAGFNFGIEIGQFVFVAVIAGFAALVAKAGATRLADRIPQLASMVAALLGMVMLVQRIA